MSDKGQSCHLAWLSCHFMYAQKNKQKHGLVQVVKEMGKKKIPGLYCFFVGLFIGHSVLITRFARMRSHCELFKKLCAQSGGRTQA